ncbi:hypothetical protein [Saccharopolyspora spinosa]|uniref:hypothetical protein n=1 Tax=Saccharopolyspora spinosa TaxID=60894 RepID=UPI001179D480|nr:hypothetical protein [Saccharopolyspora spinosa]
MRPIRKRAFALTCGTLALISLCAPAAAASGKQTEQQSFYIIHGVPITPKNEKARLDGNLVDIQSFVSPTTTEPPRRTTKSEEELAEIRRPGKYTYTADSRQYSNDIAKPFADVDDDVTSTECEQAYLGGYTGNYWFKNRYSACRGEFLIIERYVYDSNGNKVIVGQGTARTTLTINMNRDAVGLV